MFVIKSGAATAILLAAGVAGVCAIGGTRAAPTDEQVRTKKDDKATEEGEKLKGTWVLMTEEDQGRKLPEEKLQERFRLVIEGDRWTLKETKGPEKKEWKVRLDATKRPRQGDFTYLFGNNKGKVSFAIYELKGDFLKLCVAEPGEIRPTKFEGKGKNSLLLFKRSQSKPSDKGEGKPN